MLVHVPQARKHGLYALHDLIKVERDKQSACRNGNQLQHLVGAAELVAEPNHGISDTVHHAHGCIGELHHRTGDGICDAKRRVHLGQPKSPVVADVLQAVRD